MKFKVGDKVFLRKDSCYFGDDYQLPYNVVGSIIRITPSEYLPFLVQWEINGDLASNSYSKDDIKVAVKNTELARFMYPNSKESDDGKYLYV
jgi:hypothetical protein